MGGIPSLTRRPSRCARQIRTFRRIFWRRKFPMPAARQPTSVRLWDTPPRALGLPDPPRLRCAAAKTARSRTRLKEQPCLTAVPSPSEMEKFASCVKEISYYTSFFKKPRLSCPGATCMMTCHTQLYHTSVRANRGGITLPVFQNKIPNGQRLICGSCF